MASFNKTIGEKIKRLREQAGLSQEEVANQLGMNRVSLSQIENGNQKICAEELANFARFFNITTDILLDLRSEIKVVLEPEKSVSAKQEPEIRINVPQKNLEKFKEVLLYILNKVGSKPNIGETVIYKLLYFIDFDFYEKYEEQLIGATYIKNTYGPTPKEFRKIAEKMQEKELVKVKDEYFRYPQTKYLPKRPADLSKFTAQEIKLIDEVLDKLSDMNGQQISEYSHNDVPWLTTEDGKIIEYEKVFYRTPAYSVRRYREENIS